MLFSGRGSLQARLFILLGVGLGLYAHHLWSGVSIPSESELQQQVETRYRAEVATLRPVNGDEPVAVNAEWEAKFRQAIRAELLRPGEEQKRRAYATLGIGLILLVMGLGNLLAGRVQSRLSGQ